MLYVTPSNVTLAGWLSVPLTSIPPNSCPSSNTSVKVTSDRLINSAASPPLIVKFSNLTFCAFQIWKYALLQPSTVGKFNAYPAPLMLTSLLVNNNLFTLVISSTLISFKNSIYLTFVFANAALNSASFVTLAFLNVIKIVTSSINASSGNVLLDSTASKSIVASPSNL